ncbi:GAF and ANTAR domain-containing protein [Amycolatopsis antarctica]|nr:GAF and ANTAR domain-containing protein [Amycolatopsis antarctica]
MTAQRLRNAAAADRPGALPGVLDEAGDLVDGLFAVCEQVVFALPGVSLSSVTLVEGDVAATVASTDRRADEIGTEQYRTGEGPCIEATRTGRIVLVDMAGATERWPGFAAIAGALGVHSFLTMPFRVDAGLTGSLNLFGVGGQHFAGTGQARPESYATTVETMTRAHRRYLRCRDEVAELRAVVRSRAVIEQAKGILVSERKISAEDAFRILVRWSQRENRKLRDVAVGYVATAAGESGTAGAGTARADGRAVARVGPPARLQW